MADQNNEKHEVKPDHLAEAFDRLEQQLNEAMWENELEGK